MKRFLLGIAAAALVIGGCSAASHISGLQPPKVPKSPAIHVPKTSMQLGIDIDWYAYPGQDVKTQAAQTVAYIESLHANAVDVTFPFFMNGTVPSSVHATTGTPSPDAIAILAGDAEQAGLRVTLRPLMDEHSLGGTSRVHWQPSNTKAFLASYRRFLQPYLKMAQSQGVATFVEQTELSQFQAVPAWRQSTTWARSLFSGQIACAANWAPMPAPGTICGGGVTETVDAYHRQVGNLLAGWKRWDRTLPAGTVLSEVGIAATPRAFSKPYAHAWHVPALDPAVQAHWFTAACNAAAQEHLGGIYFWSVGLGTPSPGPTMANQLGWSGSAGQTAISDCFAAIEGGSL